VYEAYWELKEKPFENTPNPHFFYYSQKHEEALSRLLYALRERKGAALLTGEPGSGKTLLSRVLLEELNTDQYQMAFICNPLLSPVDLIKEIVYQLDNTTTASTKVDLLHSFNNILCLNKTKNKSTVIVIDEAQTIGHKNSFEELRLLLNYQLNKEFLLTLILLGQPELRNKINRFPQLKQRFAVRYHLNSLNQEETRHYIDHRLKVAGAEQEIFSEDACVEVFRFSTGVPRRINNICDMALLVGSAEGIKILDQKIVREVAEDLEEVPIEIS
jgi:general secretion pathway protein A